MSREAEARSFSAVDETCPLVNPRFDELETGLGELGVLLEKYRRAEADARDSLRRALTGAYEEMISLERRRLSIEQRVDELEEELETAKVRIRELEAQSVQQGVPSCES